MGNNIYTYSSEDVFYTWENTFEDNILNMFLTFFVKNENNLYERFEEEHFEKAYQEKDIEDILNEIGFNILGKFCGYSDLKPDNNSERILYVLRK